VEFWTVELNSCAAWLNDMELLRVRHEERQYVVGDRQWECRFIRGKQRFAVVLWVSYMEHSHN
jgi:hypothetical protein